MRDTLRQVYRCTSVVMMTDIVPPSSPLYPTKENILTQLKLLKKSLNGGVHGLFYASGHGLLVGGSKSMFVPTNVIEKSGNLKREFLISSSEFWDIIKDIPASSSLFTIIDACHSGELMELPYRMKMVAEKGVRNACEVQRSSNHHSTGGAVYLLASCTKKQISMDAKIEGEYSGVMTRAFCDILLATDGNITYSGMFKSVCDQIAEFLRNKNQTPQFSFTRPIDCTAIIAIGENKENKKKTLEESMKSLQLADNVAKVTPTTLYSTQKLVSRALPTKKAT